MKVPAQLHLITTQDAREVRDTSGTVELADGVATVCFTTETYALCLTAARSHVTICRTGEHGYTATLSAGEHTALIADGLRVPLYTERIDYAADERRLLLRAKYRIGEEYTELYLHAKY